MTRHTADVLIVGAGPAGAAAATHLARRGVDVLLLDRYAFPRDKVCGDFVGPIAMRELDGLGVGALPDYRRSTAVTHASLFLDGRKLITGPFPRVAGLPPYGRVVPRLELDAWLVDGARSSGARFLAPANVGAWSAARNRVRITLSDSTEFRARLLIGADGSNSLVARQLRGGVPPPRDRLLAMRAYFRGVLGPRRRAEIYFSGESFPGYYWLFPVRGSEANIGIGMVQDAFPPAAHLRVLLERLIDRDPALRRRLGGAVRTSKIVGATLTTYNPSLPLTGRGVMLVGDAAGLINPLNGEGIQNALLSGRWAADAAMTALEPGGGSESLLAYVDRVERALRFDMEIARWLVRLISNRALNDVWLEFLRIITTRARSDPRYAEITGGVLAGTLPVGTVTSGPVLAGTLEQALAAAGIKEPSQVLEPEFAGRLARRTARVAAVALRQTGGDPRPLLRWAGSAVLDFAQLAERVRPRA